MEDLWIPSLSHRDNIVVNARFRALAARLAGKQEHPHRVVARRASASPLAAPSGLALVPAPGRITVRWNRVPTAQLYEIQISTENDFRNPFTDRLGESEYTYEEGVPGQRYYVRVRALRIGAVSDFSPILDTTTGFVTTSLLDFQSVSSVYVAERTVFDPVEIGAAGFPYIARYDFSEPYESRGGWQLPFATIELLTRWQAVFGILLPYTVRLYGDEEVLDDLTIDVGQANAPATPEVPQTVTGLATPFALPVGTYTLGIELEPSILPPDEFQHTKPSRFRLEIVELIR